MVFTISVAVARIVLANANRRHDAFALTDIDDAHTAGGAAGDADAIDRAADQRAAVGDQHDLVALQHREGGHDLATPCLAGSPEAHQLHALAAASGHPVLVSRGALAEA